MENLAKALATAQGQMTAVKKTKVNPQFKSKYASLDDILEMARPIMAANGLSIVQTPLMEGELCGVETKIIHASGEILDCGKIAFPLGRTGGAQGAGSSITYARRYAISAILALSCDDDDDGNHAQSQAPKKAPVNEEQQAIQAALQAFSAEHGIEKTKALVESLGVKKASELPKNSLNKVMEAIANVQ
jgi:hypothetical protein